MYIIATGAVFTFPFDMFKFRVDSETAKIFLKGKHIFTIDVQALYDECTLQVISITNKKNTTYQSFCLELVKENLFILVRISYKKQRCYIVLDVDDFKKLLI